MLWNNKRPVFADIQDLKRYLEAGRSERRNLEYKRGARWDSLKYNITKAALAMANLEGGGYVIIGVEDGDGRYQLSGMPESDVRTYKIDDVSEFINKYADPHIEIDLGTFQNVVVVQVFEFEEVPVVCKKDSDDLERGRIYVRPRRKNESTPQPTAFDVKEILDNAIDKGIRKQRKRIRSYDQDDAPDPFVEERGEF